MFEALGMQSWALWSLSSQAANQIEHVCTRLPSYGHLRQHDCALSTDLVADGAVGLLHCLVPESLRACVAERRSPFSAPRSG